MVLSVFPKTENIMGKGDPGNTICKTRKQGKHCYHELKTYFMCFAEESLFLFLVVFFSFQISCGSIENDHFWQSVFFVIPHQWEKLYFWKCFPLFSLTWLLDMTLTGRCCPASVIMAGLARPAGRHAAGSGSRPQRGERKNGNLFLEMSIYQEHFPGKWVGKWAFTLEKMSGK